MSKIFIALIAFLISYESQASGISPNEACNKAYDVVEETFDFWNTLIPECKDKALISDVESLLYETFLNCNNMCINHRHVRILCEQRKKQMIRIKYQNSSCR